MPRPLPVTGGSVVDARTGSVGVRPVLVRDGRIAAVGDGPSRGPSTGDVVRTGFHHSRADLDANRQRPATDRRAA